VGDVADQPDGEALDAALDLADGEDVEQPLGGMLVGAVAGVDDAAIEVMGQQMGAPGTLWRTTTTSMPMASMFLAVSMNDSPLLSDDEAAAKSEVSAPRRLAAKLKLARVRVEGSKNRVTTTLPLRSDCFLRRRRLTSTNCSAVSRMVRISSAPRSSRPRRWRRVHGTVRGSRLAICTLTVGSLCVCLRAGAGRHGT
jgi:hypothetical protein